MAHRNSWFTELKDGGSFQFEMLARLPEVTYIITLDGSFDGI